MDSLGDSVTNLIALTWDKDNWNIGLAVSARFVLLIAVVVAAATFIRWWRGGFSISEFEIDQAEIGVGNSKFSFRPNLTDKQVAYAIWVELSTRKIGLPIELDHDVISEIYDSWYTFFSVTRELVKGIPVAKVQRKSTQAIIKLSIEVLNEGLRPHLTRWQARFRHWYERELKKYDSSEREGVIDPQNIQSKFPDYKELSEDLLRVNEALIRYRRKMRELVLND